MRIRKPGKIAEKLWFLGRQESCVHLLEGEKESMIISGGMSYLVPVVLQQFEDFGIDQSRITKALILHSHFDHVGIIPFLKRRDQKLQIYGSSRAWEILRMSKAIDTINRFSRDVAGRVGMQEVYEHYDLEWRDDIEGHTVSEGDCLDLGDMEVRIYEIPGHSSCSIAAYVPRIKALLASDAGGIPYRNGIVSAANSSFDKYQASLEKIKDLDVEYIGADHYGYIVGDEARHFVTNSIRAARDYRAFVERVYRQAGDIESAAQEITSGFLKENPDYMLTREIVLGVNRQIVKNIARSMGEVSGP
jgi:glyoxylase-like metal-dependent hydrolase (beta-lactamase superfamily II)